MDLLIIFKHLQSAITCGPGWKALTFVTFKLEPLRHCISNWPDSLLRIRGNVARIADWKAAI